MLKLFNIFRRKNMSKAKLEQVNKDLASLLENKADLERQIEESKVKLRHGDYGFNYGVPRLVTEDFNGNMISAGKGCCMSTHRKGDVMPDTILGNIFDDIAAKSEKLESFQVRDGYCGGFQVKCPHEYIKIKINGDSEWNFTVSAAQEIVTKLQQVINYAKGKNNE